MSFKNNAKRQQQRNTIGAMSLEQKTRLYWCMAYAFNHPKAPGIPCEEVIGNLTNINEFTSDSRPLGYNVGRLLDSVIGLPVEVEYKSPLKLRPAKAIICDGFSDDYDPGPQAA